MSRKVAVTEIIQKSDSSCVPILVDFQNGKLNEKFTSKANFILANNKKTKKNEALLSVSNEIYHGEIKENADEPTNTFIAVKRGNKIRLIEVDQCTLTHDIHTQDEEVTNKFNNKEFALKILIENFGGKKAKRYMEKKEKTKINVDSSVKDQLNKTVQEAAIPDADEAVDNLEICPPINKDATSIVNLYSIDEILTGNILGRLNEEAEAVYKFNSNELPISSEFVLNEVIRVKQIDDEDERNRLLKVLIYLDGLLNFIKLKKRVLSNVELSKISDKITTDICQRFSPKGSIKPVRSATSVDKAICYFIVLSMLIQPNLEININTLTTETARPRKKILTLNNIINVRNKNFDTLTFTLKSKPLPQKRPLKRKTL